MCRMLYFQRTFIGVCGIDGVGVVAGAVTMSVSGPVRSVATGCLPAHPASSTSTIDAATLIAISPRGTGRGCAVGRRVAVARAFAFALALRGRVGRRRRDRPADFAEL